MAVILVIDDSEVARANLKESLEKAGHKVLQAESGLAGYNLTQSQKNIDLIISDYNMPEMDGLTMCQKIREMPAYQKIPILMLTTECGPELKQKGKEIGLSGWVIKPYQEKALISVISRLVEGG